MSTLHVFVLVSSHMADFNADLQEVFGIGVVLQRGIAGTGDTSDGALVGKRTLMEGEEVCPLFDGLTLASGAVTPTRMEGNRATMWAGATVNCRLMSSGEGWVQSRLRKEGKDCVLSAWRRVGRGEVLFVVSFQRTAFAESILEDGVLEAEQNQEAARRLVRWLAGRIEYPQGK